MVYTLLLLSIWLYYSIKENTLREIIGFALFVAKLVIFLHMLFDCSRFISSCLIYNTIISICSIYPSRYLDPSQLIEIDLIPIVPV